MVFHSSYTNRDNAENFPTSKILVSFLFFNMENLFQINLREVLQKTGRKNVTKILKNTREG